MKLIDLSQEIYTGQPVFPLHQKTFIFQNVTHEQTMEKIGFPFATRNLLINEHGPTHTDAIYEYDPEGPTIDKMALNFFCGKAICLDLTDIRHPDYTTADILKKKMNATYGGDFGDARIFLMYTGHYNRNYPDAEYLDRYSGLDRGATEYLHDNGIIQIGVDAPAIDHTDDTAFSGHAVCAERGFSNTEHLANLEQVVGKRFLYMGLPLKLRDGTGSPIRACALLPEDGEVINGINA